MAQKHTLRLTEEQRRLLQEIRDHDLRGWARERCAAILKIAARQSLHWVAQKGLKARDPDAIYFWLRLYTEGGVETLFTRQPTGARRRRL